MQWPAAARPAVEPVSLAIPVGACRSLLAFAPRLLPTTADLLCRLVAFNAKSFIDNMPSSLPSSGLIIGNRRTCFCCMVLSAPRMSSSAEQLYTSPDMISPTRILLGAILAGCAHANIAVGNHADDFPAILHDRQRAEIAPHICIAAIARLVSDRQVCTSFVITSCIFIFFCLSAGIQRDAQMTCSADLAKNCAVLALPRLVERLSLEVARKLSMQSVPNDRAHKTKGVSRHRVCRIYALMRLQINGTVADCSAAKRRMGSVVSRDARVASIKGRVSKAVPLVKTFS